MLMCFFSDIFYIYIYILYIYIKNVILPKIDFVWCVFHDLPSLIKTLARFLYDSLPSPS